MATWRTTVQTSYGTIGGPGFSTFHYRDDADGGLGAALALAGLALRDAYAELRAQLPNQTVMSWGGVWEDVGGDRTETSPVWTQAGTLTGASYLPPANQIVCGWRTASRSRSGRGRTFLGGWPASASVDGTPTGSTLLAVQNFGLELVSFNETIGNGAFVVYSPTQEISRDITGSAVRDTFAVLRSRRD